MMVLGQIEIIANRLEIFGAFGVCLLMLLYAIYYLARKIDRLEADNTEMAEKSIEALTLANRVIDDSHEQGRELKATMEALHKDVLLRSCKYERG